MEPNILRPISISSALSEGDNTQDIVSHLVFVLDHIDHLLLETQHVAREILLPAQGSRRPSA